MGDDDPLLEAVKNAQRIAGEIISAAAKDGDFERVASLAARGRELGDLLQRWANSGSDDVAGNERAPSPERRSPVARKGGRAAKAITSEASAATATYPQFFRETDELVKVGWSPTARATYEHRAAKPVVDLIVKRLISMGENGHRFSMDKLLRNLSKNGTQDALPSYQAYAVIAWLKWCGLLIQHGRQGYTVAKPKGFGDSSTTAWNALPRR